MPILEGLDLEHGVREEPAHPDADCREATVVEPLGLDLMLAVVGGDELGTADTPLWWAAVSGWVRCDACGASVARELMGPIGAGHLSEGSSNCSSAAGVTRRVTDRLSQP